MALEFEWDPGRKHGIDFEDRYAEGTNVAVLDPDVAVAFPDATAVNSALRALLEIARREARSRAPAT